MTSGLDTFADYEVGELLLTLAIPCSNVIYTPIVDTRFGKRVDRLVLRWRGDLRKQRRR